MKKIILLSLFCQMAMAQSSLDTFRWYLKPDGQEILISIDDLHDEKLVASPKLNFGFETIKGLPLKKSLKIAVIDGGFDIEHPELKKHIAYNSSECFEGTTIPPKDGEDKDQNGFKGDCAGWDFVDNTNRPEDLDGHGTHVTGIINTVLSQVDGDYKLLPLKVFALNEGRTQVKGAQPLPTRLARAFDYARLMKVDLVHLSVGWPKSYMTLELENAIKKAQQSGIIIVAAAGNSSQRATIYPCQMEDVICVGALRPDGNAARFSNHGMQVDIFAPGEKILSTIPYRLTPMQISRKGYDYKNGTSQAAPFISAAMAILRGTFPQESNQALLARLLKSSDKAPDRRGLKGMFHLDQALTINPSEYLYPAVKGLQSVQVDQAGYFSVKLPLKNLWMNSSDKNQVQVTCSDAQLEKQNFVVPELASGAVYDITLSGQTASTTREISCDLKIKGETFALKLKLLNNLSEAKVILNARQDGAYVVATRSGGRSRLITLNTLPGFMPHPFYYVVGAKDPILYKQNELLGTITVKKDCRLLRLWQVDLNQDHENEIMMESMCEEKFLSYRFFNSALKELYAEIQYRPALTIINYETFELITQKDAPPTFKFINTGFAIPSDDPWESNAVSRSPHLYELFAVKTAEGFKYDVRVLEQPKLWQKALGLRYMPQYQVLHLLNDKMLVKIGEKLAWIRISDQSAEWAKLDHLLLEGTKKQSIMNSQESILQGFLTAYEYRGYILGKVTLKYSQSNRFDPLIDILGTLKNDKGYLSILQSFQKLIYLQFNEQGELISKEENLVDRFDFLTSQDMLASVINFKTHQDMIQIVDGTKLNTNYVDVAKKGRMQSFEVPVECVTQSPVILDNRPVLPIFCPVNKDEFQMRFFDL